MSEFVELRCNNCGATFSVFNVRKLKDFHCVHCTTGIMKKSIAEDFGNQFQQKRKFVVKRKQQN